MRRRLLQHDASLLGKGPGHGHQAADQLDSSFGFVELARCAERLRGVIECQSLQDAGDRPDIHEA
ncbi:hypothetical protein D3C72_1846780 [compost metagenome]